VEKLKAFLQEKEALLKYLSEALINLNYDLIKKKGYDQLVRD
jgi:hypothetical protein